MPCRTALALIAALSIAACLPGGQEDEATAGQTGGATASQEAADEPDELVVWDIYVRGKEREVANRLTEQFEDEHGVTVTSRSIEIAMPRDEMDDGPCVARSGRSRATPTLSDVTPSRLEEHP